MSLTMNLLNRVAAAMRRPPDFVIGPKADPYLRRWFLIPKTEQGGCYLHEILHDDDDRALHDHPWDAHILIVQGEYKEIREDCPDGELFKEGSLRLMRAETLHRLVVVRGPVLTLVMFGPDRREWGFKCPQGWIPWQEFVDARDSGLIGKGCG